MQLWREPCCKEHRKHTSVSFRLILLIGCVKLEVVTLLLLLCVINKKDLQDGRGRINKRP